MFAHDDSPRPAGPRRPAPRALARGLRLAPVLLLAATALGAADAQADNRAPRVVTPIEDQTAPEDRFFSLNVAANFEDPDGDALSFFAENLPPSMNMSRAGVISGTPSQDEIGRYNVRVVAIDPFADFAVDRFRIEVTSVNDPPVIVRQLVDPIRSPEDQTLRIRISDLEIRDPDSTISALSLRLQPGENYSLVSEDTLRPAADYSGLLSVPLVASDGVDDSAVFLLRVRITPVNDAPRVVTNIGDRTTNEDEPFTLDVAGTFSDPDGDALTLTVTGLPASLTLGADGVIRGTPRQPDVGRYAVTATARDPSGLTATQAFTLTVRNINDPPVITGQRELATNEDTPLTVSLADLVIVDPDNTSDELSLRLAPGPNYTVAGTTVRPAQNFAGTLTVPATVNDGRADSNTFDLRITVRSINDRPVITGQTSVTIDEDSSLRFRLDLLTVSDPDNVFPDDFSFTLRPGANYSINGDRIVPRENFAGNLSVGVTVNDGRSDSEVFGFELRVRGINDVPVITGQRPIRMDEDTERTITTADLIIDDPDDPPATLTLALSPGANYRLRGTTVIPDANFNGTLRVGATVSDAEAESNVFTLEIAVRSINDRPVIEAQRPLSTEEDTPLRITLADLTVSDPDHRYPDDFTLRVLPGENYTRSGTVVTPAPDFSGDLTVPVVVNDGVDDSPTFNLRIAVGAVNDAPRILGQRPIAIDEDSSVTLSLEDLQVEDPDDPVSALRLSLETGENYRLNGTRVTPDEDYSGALSVPATVSDGESSSDVFNIVIEVRPVNDPPVITGQLPLSTEEDTPILVRLADLLVDDPDNSYPEDFRLTLLPGDGYTLGGAREVRPAADFSGELTVPAIVSDGAAESEPFPLVILVAAVNDPPIIRGQRELVTEEDTPITITPADLLIDDPDNVFPDDFTLSLTEGDGYSLVGTTVRPDENFNGRLDIPARVSDGTSTSGQFLLRLEVRSVNDRPRLLEPIPDQQAVEDEPFRLDLSDYFADDDGDAITFELRGLPADSSLTLDPETGVLSGTPTFEDTRDFPFEVTIVATDESAASGSGSFALTIAALDRANVALAIAVTPAPALVEDEARWTLTARNAGPSAATNLAVAGRFIGEGLTITPVEGSDCDIGSATGGVTAFECELGSVPPGGDGLVAFIMATAAPGDVVLAGEVTVRGPLPIDPNLENNRAQRSLSVARSLSNGRVQALGSADVRAVSATDVDGDGDLDLIFGTGAGQPVEIYRGTGNRTFAETPVLLAETGSTEGIAVADLNGDGAPDLVFANGAGAPDSVWLNDGTGGFERVAAFGDDDSRGVAVADLNGDGRLDLAFAAIGANPIYVDNGAGAYVLVETLGNAATLGVDSADFDGDGWEDLVFANSSAASTIRLNDAGGGFAAPTRLRLGSVAGVVAADLNGDGRPDLAFARVPDELGEAPANPVLVNGGGAQFSQLAALGAAPTVDVTTGDFDADGVLDLFFVNATGTHQVWRGVGNGFALADEQIYEAGAVTGFTGDLGNDGGVDIVLGAAPRGGHLYLNDGFGRLGLGDAVPPIITLVGEPVIDLPAGDDFADPGARAEDNIDGDISSKVVATSTVDPRIVGTYKVVYTVTDAAGNSADPVSRTVRVTPAEGVGGGGGGALGPVGILLALLAGLRRRRGTRTRTGPADLTR